MQQACLTVDDDCWHAQLLSGEAFQSLKLSLIKSMYQLSHKASLGAGKFGMCTFTYDRNGGSWARLLHQQLMLLARHRDADPVALRERAVPGQRGFQHTSHVTIHRLLEPCCARLEPGILPCT